MEASIRASNGLYWRVTPSGTITATASRAEASVFSLSDDGSVPILMREVKSGHFLAVARDGTVTATHLAPDLAASAFLTEPSSLGFEVPRGFRAPDRVHWLTVHASQGNLLRADAAAHGAAETFKLMVPEVSVGQGMPELPGSNEVGSGVSSGTTLLPVAGWRQCARCGVLYDENVPASARGCFDVVGTPAPMLRGPRRLRPHSPKGDTVYRVFAARKRTAVGVLFLRCNLCAALIDHADTERPCGAAAGGKHRYAESSGYGARAALADPPLRAIPRWRVCAGCSVLYHDDGSPTVCPADTGHTPRDGVGYVLDTV